MLEINNFYELLKDNPIPFGMNYFPNHFRDESPDFHFKLIEESCKHRFFAVQAPRGSAKSTVLCFLKPIHAICFKKKRFIIIVQNTYKKAVGSLENIKDEIRLNKDIVRDFGITLEKDSEGDSIFCHPDGFRTRVLCKGVEQIGSVRGEKFGAYRPDYIIGDDMEDDEMVKSIERRQSLKDLFNNALIPAGDVKSLDVDIIGTILHDDSLMADLVSIDKYTEYRKLFYMARYKDENGKICSLWPERWTVEELNEMERQKPEAFAKEMQGDPSTGILEGIKREDFRYWRDRDGAVELLDEHDQVKSRFKWTDCKCVIVADMAWEEKRDSDFTAIVPALMTPTSDVLVDNYMAKRGMRPNEFEEIIFSWNERYEKLTGRRVQFGFEKAKLEKVMKWFLTEAMRRRNKWLWLRDLQWDGDKIQRILTRLGNRYANGSIYHRRGMGDLENQLIRIRSVAHDDVADALQGCVQLLTFAPTKVEDKKPDNMFEFFRKHTPEYRARQRATESYQFGQIQKKSLFKTVDSF